MNKMAEGEMHEGSGVVTKVTVINQSIGHIANGETHCACLEANLEAVEDSLRRAERERDDAVKLLRRWNKREVIHHDTAAFLATIGESEESPGRQE